jgi:protein gp37
MGSDTGISWTDQTWNPIVGCSKISTGCAHCYAETMARRLRGMGRPEYLEAHDGTGWSGRTVFLPERLDQPLRWRKPRRIFVCSMGDLFHESVTNEQIAAVWGVMAAAPQHAFQVLTKRPGRMAEWFEWCRKASRADDVLPLYGRRIPRPGRVHLWLALAGDAPLPNVWLGTTAEDQAAADSRIPYLLQCPAALRFVSVEPMLGEIDLDLEPHPHGRPEALCESRECSGCGDADSEPCGDWRRWRDRPRIDWVICGGESGPGARPMHPDWARGLRDQCRGAKVPFHFKQWGPRNAGHLLDGQEIREFPEVPRG